MGNTNAVQNSTVIVNLNNSLLFNSSSGAITTFNVGGLSGSGNIALADSSALTLSVGGNGTVTTYSGALSGSGALLKTGSGILTLGGTSNTYSGSTTLAAGELSISASNNLSPNSPLVFNGGILQITGVAMTSMGTTAVNWSTFNGGFDINNAANVFTLSSSIGGAGSLTKLGPGTLRLAASDSYSGATTVSAGTLSLNNANAVQNSTLIVNANNGLLFASSAGTTFNVGGLSGSGNISLADGARSRSAPAATGPARPTAACSAARAT